MIFGFFLIYLHPQHTLMIYITPTYTLRAGVSFTSCSTKGKEDFVLSKSLLCAIRREERFDFNRLQRLFVFTKISNNNKNN